MYLKPRVSKALDHSSCFLAAEETQGRWYAPVVRTDPATVRHYLSLMDGAAQVGGFTCGLEIGGERGE